MIEDMKNMMSDLSGKFNELDEKIDNVSSDLQHISSGGNSGSKTEKEETLNQQRLNTEVRFIQQIVNLLFGSCFLLLDTRTRTR